MSLLSKYREGGKRLLDDAATGNRMPPRVSIGSNRFTLIDHAGQRIEVPFMPDGAALDVVFIDRNENMSKLLWNLEGTYNSNEVAPPLCFSDNGVGPSTMSSEPQSATCSGCRHNVIGSAISKISGARMKLCGDLKKFAVVIKGFPNVYEFAIKPGSFKAWNNYTNWLSMQKMPDGGRPDLSDIVTRVRFSGQGILSFEGLEMTPNDVAEQVIEIWERNKTNDITGQMIGRYDQPVQAVLAAPAETKLAALEMPKQSVSPPPMQEQQASSIFTQQPPAKKVTRAKKEEVQPAQPAQPVAPPYRSSPPADISARLDSLFKLPPAK